MKKLALTILITITLWATLSTLEVMFKDRNTNPEYSSTNLWVIFFDKEADTNEPA